MKKDFILAIILVMVLPILLSIFFLRSESTMPNTVLKETDPPKQSTDEETIDILVGDVILTMPLDQYITSVVLAEMPADFEMEALKAQAVVARTYTCRRIMKPKHEQAPLCTDSKCCQAYIAVDAYLDKGGSENSVTRIRDAVIDTKGYVLTYAGEYIEATYFSCSGGKTEDAQAVWGSSVPYLKSVESPGEEKATHYIDTVSFTLMEFCEKMDVQLFGFSEEWIGQITYTEGGGVDTIELGDQLFTGTTVRNRLNLRSTAFSITAVGDTISVTTKGFGHRVGMSQYGAEAMAMKGHTFQEILEHYYSGVSIEKVSG